MKKLALSAFAAAALVCAPMAASAATITIQLTTEFSGGDAPGGTSPYLTATFTDVAAGVVQLTMDGTNLINDEFVSEWSFNLDPTLDVTALSVVNSSGVVAQDVDLGTDAFKADGVGGFYDILFSFFQAPPGARFGAGDISVYTLSLANLTASSFNTLSVGGLNFASAAHVQGIGPNGEGSGWIGGLPDDGDNEPELPEVPEPTSFALLGFGGLLLVSRHFLRRKK
jgi:hypothetical protein